MLSVLIPTYNYNISNLTKEIHIQLVNSGASFEIIVYEDGSIKNINNLEHLSHSKVLKNDSNIGRVKSRQFLAKKAKYDWILFLDADVIPTNSNFISDYLNSIKYNYDIIYGGIAYRNDKPEKDYILRWKYGKLKEQVVASKRNLSPYKNTSSGNFIVKKQIFLDINSKIKQKAYGNDNYFGALLKDRKIAIFHINNNVYHLGLEKSNDYIIKKELAAKTLLNLYNSNKVSSHDNGLLKTFVLIKKLKLTRLLGYLHKVFKRKITKNLTSKTPSITLLQLYRISFMCQKFNQQ